MLWWKAKATRPSHPVPSIMMLEGSGVLIWLRLTTTSSDFDVTVMRAGDMDVRVTGTAGSLPMQSLGTRFLFALFFTPDVSGLRSFYAKS
jgi:hypothetical protein